LRAIDQGTSFADFVNQTSAPEISGAVRSVPSFSSAGPRSAGPWDDISRAVVTGGYSLREVIAAATEHRPLDGLEAEVDQEIARRMGQSARRLCRCRRFPLTFMAGVAVGRLVDGRFP
jgi:hypothetical protein